MSSSSNTWSFPHRWGWCLADFPLQRRENDEKISTQIDESKRNIFPDSPDKGMREFID
jgi:hypothetical protein